MLEVEDFDRKDRASERFKHYYQSKAEDYGNYFLQFTDLKLFNKILIVNISRLCFIIYRYLLSMYHIESRTSFIVLFS